MQDEVVSDTVLLQLLPLGHVNVLVLVYRARALIIMVLSINGLVKKRLIGNEIVEYELLLQRIVILILRTPQDVGIPAKIRLSNGIVAFRRHLRARVPPRRSAPRAL